MNFTFGSGMLLLPCGYGIHTKVTIATQFSYFIFIRPYKTQQRYQQKNYAEENINSSTKP